MLLEQLDGARGGKIKFRGGRAKWLRQWKDPVVSTKRSDLNHRGGADDTSPPPSSTSQSMAPSSTHSTATSVIEFQRSISRAGQNMDVVSACVPESDHINDGGDAEGSDFDDEGKKSAPTYDAAMPPPPKV